MSGFNIYGDNNRAAGRDYHEHAAPDVCPRCEDRLLSAGRVWCRHCEDEHNQIKRERLIRKITRNRILGRFRIALFALVISVLFLAYSDKDLSGYPSVAFLISLVACCVFSNALKNYPPDDDK
ncbi:hypothetical protein I2494_04535 [Budviciaceae bacterium BWR-B9]|uniref:C2H2-type domain-containing protein n=1 Tax=Limnobaculum allomyrinae TaxID=2791986 RepID=A0ABS1INV9_9GAMM|nr:MULTISPECIES: hypothetical protein [Limnobaculum]MBK5142990.1 hypothetical protein [Limnobaculum allomyrinae]MBV7693319.1 hypothetical protein [Limnobaculum sp. M2-1]